MTLHDESRDASSRLHMETAMEKDAHTKNSQMNSLREEAELDRALCSQEESIGRALSDEARRQRSLRWAFVGFTSVIITIGVFVAVMVMGMRGESSPRQDSSWFIEDGWKLYKIAEYILAERRFVKAVEMNPGLPEAWCGLGQCRLREGFVNEAHEAFERAAELGSRDSRVNEGLGFTFFANGEYKKAKEHWLAIQHKSAETLVGLARLYVLQERFEEALPLGAEAVQQLPDDGLAQKLHAAAANRSVDDDLRARLKPGNTTRISEYSHRANEKVKSAMLTTQNMWPQLSEEFYAAIFENPYEFSAHLGLAKCLLLYRYDSQSALRHYEFCFQIDPAHAGARDAVIESFFNERTKLRNPADAIETLERLEKIEPSPIDAGCDEIWRYAVLEMADLCRVNHWYDKALHYYQRMEKTSPGPELHAGLGRTYLETEQYGRAIEVFEKLTEPCPAKGYMWLGNTYFRMGRYEKAAEYFCELAELDPRIGLDLLSNAYRKLGRNEEANAQLEKLLEIYKSDIDAGQENYESITPGMIYAYHKLGKFDDAAAYFQQLDSTLPSPNIGTCGLARVYHRRREYDKAIECYKRLAGAEDEDDSIYRQQFLSVCLEAQKYEEVIAELERVAAEGGRNPWFEYAAWQLDARMIKTPGNSALQERIDRLKKLSSTRS